MPDIFPNYDFFEACEIGSFDRVRPFLKSEEVFAWQSDNNIPRGFTTALTHGHSPLAFGIIKSSKSFSLNRDDTLKVKTFLCEKNPEKIKQGIKVFFKHLSLEKHANGIIVFIINCLAQKKEHHHPNELIILNAIARQLSSLSWDQLPKRATVPALVDDFCEEIFSREKIKSHKKNRMWTKQIGPPRTLTDVMKEVFEQYPSFAPLAFLYGVNTFDAALLAACTENTSQNKLITKMYLSASEVDREDVATRFPLLASRLERAFLLKNLPQSKEKGRPKKM